MLSPSGIGHVVLHFPGILVILLTGSVYRYVCMHVRVSVFKIQ